MQLESEEAKGGDDDDDRDDPFDSDVTSEEDDEDDLMPERDISGPSKSDGKAVNDLIRRELDH